MKRIYFVLTIILIVSCKSLVAQDPYIYETDEYKISFPNKPEIFTQSKSSNLGELQITFAAYEPKDSLNDNNYLYMTIDSNYPDSTIHSEKTEMLDNFFRGAIDGAVTDIKGVLLNESNANFGIYPSRTIEINYGNGQAIIKMKLILIENKLLMIQTITATTKYPNPTIDKFFNSLILK